MNHEFNHMVINNAQLNSIANHEGWECYLKCMSMCSACMTLPLRIPTPETGIGTTI
ncbi:MAG TPA: hypothetical protein VIK78_11225 [Ruminiclostridium sp.]